MEVDQEFHDKVAKLCLERFKTLPKSGKPKPSEWTILSCIVLELDRKLSVVALGTGSKCIGKIKMSPKGDVLNDSHAEVICRRSFLRYTYNQMLRTNRSILKFNELSKNYTFPNAARFHFFTTHVPCGDAAIFPKDTVEDFGQVVEDLEEEVPRKIAKVDIFRTGAKCLAGDEKSDLKQSGSGYHVLGAVRTKPGRGDPTLSISCSDKLSRWCHLGVQGALLSLLLEKPVYFSTFTIAGKTPFSRTALERAMYDRLGTIAWCNQRVVIGQSVFEFDFAKSESKQPSDCSISWCDIEEKSLEVAVEGRRQGVTKKNLETPSARLKICKLELFKYFVQVCEQRKIKLGLSCDVKTLNYKQVKMLAVDYNDSWRKLRESFKVWTSKDVNLLHFFIK